MKNPKRPLENPDKKHRWACVMLAALVLFWGAAIGGIYVYTTWDSGPDKVIANPQAPAMPPKIAVPYHIAAAGKLIKPTHKREKATTCDPTVYPCGCWERHKGAIPQPGYPDGTFSYWEKCR